MTEGGRWQICFICNKENDGGILSKKLVQEVTINLNERILRYLLKLIHGLHQVCS